MLIDLISFLSNIYDFVFNMHLYCRFGNSSVHLQTFVVHTFLFSKPRIIFLFEEVLGIKYLWIKNIKLIPKGQQKLSWQTNRLTRNKKLFFCSEGSVGVDYLITFIDVSGVSHENLRQELLGSLDLTNNGAFISGSTFKVSNKTNSSEVAMELIFQGK